MTESRSAAEDASTRNLALVDHYFDCVTRGDPAVADLLADDVVWRTPASSPMPGPFEGRDAVLELMGSAVGLYDPETPLDIRRVATAASGDCVFAEIAIHGRTIGGEAYENAYVFVFTVRDGRIAFVNEHLDTHYAQRKLFDPAGEASPLDRSTPPPAK